MTNGLYVPVTWWGQLITGGAPSAYVWLRASPTFHQSREPGQAEDAVVVVVCKLERQEVGGGGGEEFEKGREKDSKRERERSRH